jgi:crossover junction endodeoxyribonuclease RuvC
VIILGIDPGIAIVGWGVVDYTGNKFTPIAYGSIQTPKELSTEERLARIYHELTDIIRTYHPASMAVEELFFNTNQTTGIRVA